LKGKVVAEEMYKHFQGEHRKAMLELNEARAKASDYFHQLSFASTVRDAAWADGIHLRFETFWTWWRDPARKMDLNQINIKDIPCTNEVIWRLTTLGREEMPDAMGFTDLDYHPPTPKPEAVPEGREAREASGDGEAALVVQDPLPPTPWLFLRGRSR
jgi:hypothetical protein